MKANPPTKVSLFVTCIVDQLYPHVGASVVRVLRRLGVNVEFPAEQTCCGQPAYNSGFRNDGRVLARRVLETFSGADYVVVPSGSCAAMMRVSYQELFREDPDLLRQARALASKVYEFSEFLVDVLGIEDVGAVYRGTATFHPSCHQLRDLEVRDAPRRLLQRVEGLELQDLPDAETCCGFGGTFSVKFTHISEGMLAEKIDNIMSTGADTLISCDLGCLMNIGGSLSRRGSSIKVMHLAQVLDREDR